MGTGVHLLPCPPLPEFFTPIQVCGSMHDVMFVTCGLQTDDLEEIYSIVKSQ